MASFTFGSVGDIITICGILGEVIRSLNSSRGASVEYQNLVKELSALAQTIYTVCTLLQARPNLKNNGALRQAIGNCKECLLQEYNRIEPYRKALQSNQTASNINTIIRKIRRLSTKVVVQSTIALTIG